MCSTTRGSAAISLFNGATFVGRARKQKAPRRGIYAGRKYALKDSNRRAISKLGGAIAVPKKSAPPKDTIQRVTRVIQYFTRARCQLIKRKGIATSRKGGPALALKRPAHSLLALSDSRDPFYVTPGRRALAQWFARIWDVLNPPHGYHLRRLHYRLVVMPDAERPKKLNGAD